MLTSHGVYTAQVIIEKLDQNKATLRDIKKFTERCPDLVCYKEELLAARTKKTFIKILCNAIKEA